MSLSQSRRKSFQEGPASRLEEPEHIPDAEAQDRALVVRAQRRCEEIAAERAEFELSRDRIVFVFELGLATVTSVAFTTLVVIEPNVFSAALLGGGGLGCLRALRRSGRG